MAFLLSKFSIVGCLLERNFFQQQQCSHLKGCRMGAKGTHVMAVLMMMVRTLELTIDNGFAERACSLGVKGTHRSIKHISEQ